MKNVKLEIIILVIFWIMLIISLIINPNIGIFLWIGIVGLAVSTVLYKKYYEYSLILLLVLLLVGSLNLITFNSAIFINVSILSFDINLPVFVMFLLLIYKRFYIIKGFFEKTDEEKKIDRRNRIDFFKDKFKNFSEFELLEQLKKNNLVPEAKTAVIEMLESKRNV